MGTRPTALKETAQIKKENLVGDTYTIANEDINEDEWYKIGQVEQIKEYIISELDLDGEIVLEEIVLSSVDREYMEQSLQAKRK